MSRSSWFSHHRQQFDQGERTPEGAGNALAPGSAGAVPLPESAATRTETLSSAFFRTVRSPPIPKQSSLHRKTKLCSGNQHSTRSSLLTRSASGKKRNTQICLKLYAYSLPKTTVFVSLTSFSDRFSSCFETSRRGRPETYLSCNRISTLPRPFPSQAAGRRRHQILIVRSLIY